MLGWDECPPGDTLEKRRQSFTVNLARQFQSEEKMRPFPSGEGEAEKFENSRRSDQNSVRNVTFRVGCNRLPGWYHLPSASRVD